MTLTDIIVLVAMAGAAVVAAAAFASITKYLFDHGLADRRQAAPNIVDFYKTYTAHTRKAAGRIGAAFWIHIAAVGLFVLTGVVYTIVRLILPRLL